MADLIGSKNTLYHTTTALSNPNLLNLEKKSNRIKEQNSLWASSKVVHDLSQTNGENLFKQREQDEA